MGWGISQPCLYGECRQTMTVFHQSDRTPADVGAKWKGREAHLCSRLQGSSCRIFRKVYRTIFNAI